jgi:hypothetical protein
MSNTLTVTEVVNSVTVTPVNNTVEITTGISAGSTTTAGILQLTDSVSSTSTTTAATPNSVKTAYDLANIRNPLIKRPSTAYFASPNYIATASMTITHQRTYYSPIYISETTSIDRIAIRTSSIFSGTTSVRLGIYNHDYSTGLPTTVLLDAGTVSVTALSTIYEITISQTLGAGFYWVVMCQQGTAPTTSSYTGNSTGSGFNLYMQTSATPTSSQHSGYHQSSVTSAFATASSLSVNTQVPFVWLRVA